MRVGVVGGGLMGLAVAQQLSDLNHEVVVFERGEQLGGLTTHHDYIDFIWDRFYHVILPSDQYLIEFIKKIGLGDRLRWQPTRTGYFVNNKMYSLSNNIEFLKFPLLSLWAKFRLALGIIFCTRIKDWKSLERVTVEQWLIKYTGREAFNKFWLPLLLAKLGENYKRVSAVFIWSYITRLFSARDPSVGKESLGHVSGCYKTIFDRLHDRISSNSGSILMNTAVERISQNKDKIVIEYANSSKNAEEFDKVIFTSPATLIERIVDSDLVDMDKKDGKVEYLGVVCMVIVTNTPLTEFYVTNIADEEIPFTGVIGMSTVVDTKETNNKYITYLPKYIHSNDSYFEKSDDEIEKQFLKGLKKIYPDYNMDDVEKIFINRAKRVQPLQTLNYSEIIPRVETNHPNFLILNTSQFTNNTLNNNEVVRSVNEFLTNNFATQ